MIIRVAVVFAIITSTHTLNQIHSGKKVDLFSSAIDQTKMTNIDTHYKADYEIPKKSLNGIENHFTVYLIDEGDLFVKKHCKCQPQQQCVSKNVVQLSK